MPKPFAHTSGLTRPSNEGPIELNVAYCSKLFTAPMVNAPIASAGVPMCGSFEAPEFPALITTTIPLLNAILAPREEKVLFPIISL